MTSDTATKLHRKPKDLNAEFKYFATLDDLPDEQNSFKILQRCAYLVGPIMRRRGWAIEWLTEIEPSEHYRGICHIDDEEIDGQMVEVCFEIELLTRSMGNPTKFLSVWYVLQTMLHELAHIEHRHHFLPFFRLNARLLLELQEDVKSGELKDVDPSEIPDNIAEFRDICSRMKASAKSVLRSRFRR